MRCTSNGRLVSFRTSRTTSGPNEMLSTKWPSMMSQWIQSAPADSTLRTSSARFEKSAARIDGATRIFDINANVQRSTPNVQRSIRGLEPGHWDWDFGEVALYILRA